MKTTGLACAAMAASVVFGAGGAHAATELRVGVFAHNIRVIDPKNANKEPGPDVELEAVFGAPHMLRWAGGPHPYALAMINTQGQTSYAAAGLEWQWEFAQGWKLEPGIGLAIHNGKLDNAYPNGTPQSAQYAREHVLLGSRVLFHPHFGIERALGEHWGAEVTYEHLSNGQVLHHGRNQGIDEAGLRIGYKFGG